MKKILPWILALVLAVGNIGFASAAGSRGSFSGGVRSGNHSVFSNPSRSYNSGTSSYSSGVKSPSSNVTQRPSTQQPYQGTAPRKSLFGGMGNFLGGMATGALVGSLFGHMFHPFGGLGYGFSPLGILFDLLLVFVGFKLIRRLMRR